MPEQLAFDQLLGDGRAIHFDERSVTPIATQMQEMRDELFAGSVLTVNQHPPICGRGELDLLAQCLHGDRVADHHVFLIDLLPQEPVFFLESPLMQGVFYNQQRLLEREGFFDEIKSPQFRGPHGGLNRSMARNHYDGGQGRNLPNLLQHLQAVHARKPDIEQDDGKVPAREERQALLTAGHCEGVEPFVAQNALESRLHTFFVVHYENRGPAHGRWRKFLAILCAFASLW